MNNYTTLGRFYKKGLEFIVPGYAVLSLLFCFGLNDLIYFGIQKLMNPAIYYDMSLKLDRMIPFRTEWIIIYWSCYIFWAVNYILISREGKEKWFRFVVADVLSRLICGIFFVFLPTTMSRPDVVGSGVFDAAMRALYSIDPATNLFPSIHCLVSWFCYIGIRNSRKVPKWYQWATFFYTLLVFVCVLLVKQHVIVDVFAGIILAQLCYYIGKHTELYKWIEKVFDFLTAQMLGAGYEGKKKMDR